jgi:hypothetical protein
LKYLNWKIIYNFNLEQNENMEQSHNELAKNLALSLIYLSAWKEKDTDEYGAHQEQQNRSLSMQ